MAPCLNLKNLHLIVSLCVVVPAAFLYGLNPEYSLPLFFDFKADSTDIKNVFRAIMCLYLSISFIWVLGLLKPSYWRTASIMNLVFMGGLGLGRLLSLIMDGWPSPTFAYGFLGELILAFYSGMQLKKDFRQHP